jgi:ABC-type transporter Mla subunit MlaD
MEYALNIAVIILSTITILFCMRLNSKIMELRNSKKDLGDLVQTFDNAIVKTHKNIADLKQMSQSSATELHQYVEKASELISDLSFMTDTASSLADRLEAAIRAARQEALRYKSSAPAAELTNHQEIEQLLSKMPTLPKEPANDEVEASKARLSKTRDELMKIINMIKSG